MKRALLTLLLLLNLGFVAGQVISNIRIDQHPELRYYRITFKLSGRDDALYQIKAVPFKGDQELSNLSFFTGQGIAQPCSPGEDIQIFWAADFDGYETEGWRFRLEATLSTLYNGLVAYYPLNWDTQDYSGNGYHLTNIGASLVADKNGKSESAYHFSGSDYLESTSVIGIGGGDITISVWYKPLSVAHSREVGGWAGIASTYNASSNTEYSVFHSGEGKDASFLFGGGMHKPFEGVWVMSATYELDRWYHLVYTMSAEKQNLFVNGEHVRSADPTSIPSQTSSRGMVRIGKGCATMYNSVIGDIDNVRFYNRVLTEDEILQIYNLEK